MRLLRTVLALLVAVGGLVLLGAGPATACSCVEGSPGRYLRWSDVVFVGRVTDIEERVRQGRASRYTFAVHRVFEGARRVGPVAVVTSAADPSACGLDGIRLHEDYVVFAGAGREGLGASSCGGTTRAGAALEDAIVAELGRPADAVVAAAALAGGVVALAR